MSTEGQKVPVGVVVRVGVSGQKSFQLRKGEQGISVFDPAAVDPPLSVTEILECFRGGSELIRRAVATIAAKGLQVIPVVGAATSGKITPGPP